MSREILEAMHALAREKGMGVDLARADDLGLRAQEAVAQAHADVQRPARDVVDRHAPLAVGDAARGCSEGLDVGVGD